MRLFIHNHPSQRLVDTNGEKRIRHCEIYREFIEQNLLEGTRKTHFDIFPPAYYTLYCLYIDNQDYTERYLEGGLLPGNRNPPVLFLFE